MKKRRGNGEGTIYQDGPYWVAEINWTDERGAHRRRRKRPTQASAIEARERLKADVRLGNMPSDETAQVSVAQAVALFLSEKSRDAQGVAPRTLRDYRTLSERFIIPALGKKRAHAVRRLDITSLLSQVKGVRQRQYVQMLAKAVITPYLRNVEPNDHPFPRGSNIRVKRREYIPLTADERGRLLRALEHDALGAFDMLAMATGLRESELLGLRWCEIVSPGVVYEAAGRLG